MLLLLGLIIWTLVPTDCSPYNTEHEDKECNKRRADIDGKSSCKETELNEKCFPVCPENQTTLYDLNRNLTKQDRLLSNNDFLDDDEDAIAEDRISMMESDYNNENLTSKEIEDDIYEYTATSDKEKVLNRRSLKEDIYRLLGLATPEMVDQVNEQGQAITTAGQRIPKLNKRLIKLSNRLNQLESENKELKDKLKEVQLYCNDVGQDARKNTMVIHGIPFNEGENTTNLFLKISEATGVPFFSKDIDYAYRLEPHTQGSDVNDSLPIIVRLLRNSDYRKFMNHEKPCNVYTTGDLEWLKMTCKLQINESLTPYNDKLYDAALALKLEGKIKNAWVREGKILIMKEDGSEPVELKTSEDLDEFN